MKYLLALLFSLSTSLTIAAQTTLATKEFAEKVSALEKKGDGRIGVAVLSDKGVTLFSYRADERFAMCSTFKALLGAAILARVDAGLETLDRPISYQASDLLDYAPITKEKLSAGQMSVEELAAAAIQYSDNTAANLLLSTMGGPKAFTDYLRAIGDKITRLDRNEPSLNSNLADDVRDTSTPAAMAATLRKLTMTDALSPASKEQLKAWMFGNTTGDAKLRAGFDQFWMIGDKTGSGANGASNDIAIVYPRKTAAFVITVLTTGSTASGDAKNAVIAEVARIVNGLVSDTSKKSVHSPKTKSLHASR